MNPVLDKGPTMEEALRAYFIKSGYYTLRSVPFVFQGFDVTDVDIWLYDRPSPVSRQRIIVDVKNKKTPQAIERIFWAKGLQSTLDLDQAIVATTDKRPDVAQFGREHGVVVLDGNFLARLRQGGGFPAGRMTEEELIGLIDSYSTGKLAGDWKGRLRGSKQLVLKGLHYNQINYWISEGRYFAEQVLLVRTHRVVAARILYILVSFVAIAVDYVMKDLAFSDQNAKFDHISNGLKYGSAGIKGTRQLVDMALGLVDQYAPEMRGVGGNIRRRLEDDLESTATRIPAEYLSRTGAAQQLYAVALELEAAAYDKQFRAPVDLSAEARSLLSVLVDFWGIDRVRFADALRSDNSKTFDLRPDLTIGGDDGQPSEGRGP